ncbi:MAG TPA: cyanophycin synthetase, partial [Telluria sp.]|nr:cyanophycin synthetase [Telluria sp.]
MKITEQRFLRGPNLYANKPLLFSILDLEDLDEIPSNAIHGFTDRLLQLLPTLWEHRCSVGRHGGFVQRLRDGTYPAHIVEHVTLELQCLVGHDVGYGRAREVRGRPRHYRVVCAYHSERVVCAAFDLAIALVDAVAHGMAFDLAGPLDELRALAERTAVGPSTASVIAAARKRGIPVFRLSEDANLFQLGWGSRQKRIQATATGNTGLVAADIASDKHLTKELLAQAGVPVPEGETVDTVEDALRVARALGVPCAVKPLDANQGKGVTTACASASEVMEAFAQARRHGTRVIVERSLCGRDYRVLVAGHKVAAAACRRPPSVCGDGRHSIRELVQIENRDPMRGAGHARHLTCITLDDIALGTLARQGYTPEDVPPPGQSVALRGNANLSTGGTAEDVTDLLPEETRELCVRAARAVGLDVAGVDIVCEDIALPLAAQGGAIIEVNAAPGIRMHEHPSRGRPRDAGGAIVESMFGHGDGRIPVIAVTGTNGKTTSALLAAHVARATGLSTGVTTTSGIYINGRMIMEGDCAGYHSARTLLMSPEVDFAVLETARGGILKRGLAFDRSDVSIILNVSDDHLGLDGVETVDDLARVKAVLAAVASRA